MKAPSDEATLSHITTKLSRRIEDQLIRYSLQPTQRILIALAGVPGSGKSTISGVLLKSLRDIGIDNVAVVPMDGFHFTKKTLATFPCPETALRRRGAPFTFDADAFVHHVLLLKNGMVTQVDRPELGVRLPSFDHKAQDPVEGDIYVPSSAKVVIVEGNYLLLDERPWNRATAMFDERWFVDVAADIARERLIQRHIAAGIEKTRQDAAARVEENDIQNGALIRAKLIEPDCRIIN